MKQKILIELDALLDTRIAVVSQLSPEAAIDLLNSDYRVRPSDEIGLFTDHITTEQFQEAYKKRDATVLPISRPTAIMFAVNQIVRKLEREMYTLKDKVESIEVEVNVYPYVLPQNVMDEIAINVMTMVGCVTPVRSVFYPPFHLTPTVIARGEYSALVLYNLQDWINGALVQEIDPANCCPTVTLFAPALLKTIEGVPTNAELTDAQGVFTDPFLAHSRMFAQIIGLDFWPVDFFSIVDLNEILEETPSDENADTSKDTGSTPGN